MGDLMFFTEDEERYIKYIQEGKDKEFTDKFADSFYAQYKEEFHLAEEIVDVFGETKTVNDTQSKIEVINHFINNIETEETKEYLIEAKAYILSVVNDATVFEENINIIRFILLYSKKDLITNSKWITTFAKEISLLLNHPSFLRGVKEILDGSYSDFSPDENTEPTITMSQSQYYKLFLPQRNEANKEIAPLNEETPPTEISDDNVIVPLKYRTKLTKTQFNRLFNGLVRLECINVESKTDFSNFMGFNTNPDVVINKIEWKKSKSLCAYFIDAFNKVILKWDRNQWGYYEKLFDKKRLVSAKNDYKKTGVYPEGHVEIKNLIDRILRNN